MRLEFALSRTALVLCQPSPPCCHSPVFLFHPPPPPGTFSLGHCQGSVVLLTWPPAVLHSSFLTQTLFSQLPLSFVAVFLLCAQLIAKSRSTWSQMADGSLFTLQRSHCSHLPLLTDPTHQHLLHPSDICCSTSYWHAHLPLPPAHPTPSSSLPTNCPLPPRPTPYLLQCSLDVSSGRPSTLSSSILCYATALLTTAECEIHHHNWWIGLGHEYHCFGRII